MNTGRTIVITGASSGFGEAAVRAFADRGDRVWGTMRGTETRNAEKKAALEAYSPNISIIEMDVTQTFSVTDGFARALEEGPIDVLINNAGIMYIGLVEPGPFPSNLLPAGKTPAHEDVLASYGELRQVPTTMISGFTDLLASEEAPDPQLVVDVYLALADAGPGQRPTRTVVGITWGVDEMNAFTQPRQDALLKAMQLDSVLGGADT